MSNNEELNTKKPKRNIQRLSYWKQISIPVAVAYLIIAVFFTSVIFINVDMSESSWVIFIGFPVMVIIEFLFLCITLPFIFKPTKR